MSSNLDGPRDQRTQSLSEELMETLDSNLLWFEYGIDDSITVSTAVCAFALSLANCPLSSSLLHIIFLEQIFTKCYLLIFYINLSKELLKTISLLGSVNISLWNMAKLTVIKYLTISTGASTQCPRFLIFGIFTRGETSNSGQGRTPKHSWRSIFLQLQAMSPMKWSERSAHSLTCVILPDVLKSPSQASKCLIRR